MCIYGDQRLISLLNVLLYHISDILAIINEAIFIIITVITVINLNTSSCEV